MKDKDILYFATHAFSNLEGSQNENYIVFSGDFNSDYGLISAKEIQKMKLNADLAILSACQTGLGKPKNSGALGLSRAFYLAGVRNILMTLWSVDDMATFDFMEIFTDFMKTYTNLQYATIHRKAILEFKEKYPDPYYWGAFTMFGFSDVPDLKEKYNTYFFGQDHTDTNYFNSKKHFNLGVKKVKLDTQNRIIEKFDFIKKKVEFENGEYFIFSVENPDSLKGYLSVFEVSDSNVIHVFGGSRFSLDEMDFTHNYSSETDIDYVFFVSPPFYSSYFLALLSKEPIGRVNEWDINEDMLNELLKIATAHEKPNSFNKRTFYLSTVKVLYSP
jgi:hypothetical protein